MSADSVGEIFASRELYYVDQTNTKKTVSVLLGKPQAAADSSGFECRFQVVGAGSEFIQTARGHDSIQALQSALILIAASLNHLNERLGRKLIWKGGFKGELGFP